MPDQTLKRIDQRHLLRIRECITNNKTVKQDKLIAMITPKIIGWGNFYRHASQKEPFHYWMKSVPAIVEMG